MHYYCGKYTLKNFYLQSVKLVEDMFFKLTGKQANTREKAENNPK